MKKTISILILTAFVASCKMPEPEKKIKCVNDMKKPIIVVAVKKREPDAGFSGGFGSIILKDSDGIYKTFEGNYSESDALIATYNAGDTIR